MATFSAIDTILIPLPTKGTGCVFAFTDFVISGCFVGDDFESLIGGALPLGMLPYVCSVCCPGIVADGYC